MKYLVDTLQRACYKQYDVPLMAQERLEKTMTKLDREYERFRGGAAKPSSQRLHITLNNKGIIYLNKNAHRLMGRPEAVYIYFSRDKDELALESTSPRLADAFPVKTTLKAHGYVIHANPVTKHFGIRLDGTNRFIDPTLDPHGILHLKLSDIVQTARGKRKKK
jgi:hypothetical protein